VTGRLKKRRRTAHRRPFRLLTSRGREGPRGLGHGDGENGLGSFPLKKPEATARAKTLKSQAEELRRMVATGKAAGLTDRGMEKNDQHAGEEADVSYLTAPKRRKKTTPPNRVIDRSAGERGGGLHRS